MNNDTDVPQQLEHLKGIKVLDMSQFEAGPSCTEVLAWLGAEVVKLENPKGGDPARRSFKGPGTDDSWYFLLLNANKKSLSIDVKSVAGLEIVKELAKRADVFIENFAPGVIERLGLGYEALREINPRLIYAQVKGYGRGSPNEHMLAFDMIAQATGGLMSITGTADGPPMRLGITLGDTGAGMLIAISLLAALFRRVQTGHGEHLDIAMQDAMLHYLRAGFSAQALRGGPALRVGNKMVSGSNPPCGIYRCKPFGPNDYVCLYTSHNNPDHWRRVLMVIGRTDLIGDPRYDTQQARAQHEPGVDALVTTWSQQHDKWEAERQLSAAGLPCGAIRDTDELLNDPDFEARAVMQVMQHPVKGPFKMPVWPVLHDGKAAAVGPAPLLGEHSEQVLREWLAMSAGQLKDLKDKGVIA